MQAQFMVVVFYYLLGMYSLTEDVIQFIGDETQGDIDQYKPLNFFKEGQRVETWFFWIMQVPMLMTCYTNIMIKSSQDIIQGISKLDYLYKVSTFQRVKICDLDENKN